MLHIRPVVHILSRLDLQVPTVSSFHRDIDGRGIV